MEAGAGRALAVLVAAGLAVGAASCRERPRAGAVPRPNLLLVTIDTLRADRVGAYGHARAETPAFDSLSGCVSCTLRW